MNGGQGEAGEGGEGHVNADTIGRGSDRASLERGLRHETMNPLNSLRSGCRS